MVSDRSIKPEEITNASINQQRTVMLVEDSEADRVLYRRYLERDREYHYSFIEVETGEVALEIYSKSLPDIILLDYLLPDMNGLEWLNLWQKQNDGNLCPVIILTGQDNENIAVKSIKLGAADYLVKGQITAEKLQFSVDRAIATQQLQQEKDHLIAQIIYHNEDISKRKNLELSQQKTLQHLSNLRQIDKAIIEAQHPQAIATIGINNIQQLLTCQRASIVTFDQKHQTATILVTKGRAKQSIGDGLETPLHIWQDLIARLQQGEQNYIIANLAQLPHLSAAIPALAASELDCVICFSLRVHNKLLGILKLWVENIEVITPEELIMIEEISTQLAIALHQANLTQAIQNYASNLENKVLERNAQLEEINQELEAFSYSISHDLKAPLRAIQGFAIALQEDYGENLDDLGREYTQRLAASAQQMERLIQDLLAYSRLSRTESQKQPVNLILVVAKAIEELDSQITEAQAEITVEHPLSNMFGNRTILLQIVNNLLSNAIKFVEPNIKPQIHIWTEIPENYVRLWVEDNGIGIEPQHQERIFQVFERLHGNEAYPGTGIGLAIVKKGIERLGGRLGVESEVNRGSLFWIELPPLD